MKHLPIGIQSFGSLIEGNYLYVDKTRGINDLFADGGKYYFLARPRRFGKSLLISTLLEIFSGNKPLFKDLWIYDKIDFKIHPVIHIDFTGLNYKTPGRLEETLGRVLEDIAGTYGVSLDPDRYYNEKFKQLIVKLSSKGKVVILIDEYDKPIIDKIEDEEIAAANRDILREFYAIIKTVDQHIRFALITGVSKFSRVSVFSGLNNLRDITLSDKFSTLLGYTEDELRHYFRKRIEAFCKKKNLEIEQLSANIKGWYNGYSWDGVNFVYNPHSILNFFQEEKFDNYWFVSATPSFLIKQIRKYSTPIEKFENYEADKTLFESYDVDKMNVVSLLFQTGYITIKRIEEISLTSRMYYLSYPNSEVKESFLKHLLSEFSGVLAGRIGSTILLLNEKLNAGDLDDFFEMIKSLFSSIPYNIFVKEKEGYYHSIVYLLLTLMGINLQAEVQTNRGRVDAVVETENAIYIMEFKMGSAESALTQIKEKEYHKKFRVSSKPVKLIGIGFDANQRNIGDYKIEEVLK